MPDQKPRIVCFAGSTRAKSVNRKMARAAADCAARLGAEGVFVDLKDFLLPVFDCDLENDAAVIKTMSALRPVFADADGFFVTSPEYNGGYPALLKNVLDWLSRATASQGVLAVFKGKTSAVVAATAENISTSDGVRQLRELMQNLGTAVVPETLLLIEGHRAFDDRNQLTDAAIAGKLDAVMQSMMNAIGARAA